MKTLRILALALCFASQGALAITETYTNKARFLTLSGARSLTDSYPSGVSGVTTFESRSITFSSANGISFDPYTSAFPGNELDVSGLTNLDLEVSAPVPSIGFDIITVAATVLEVRLYRDAVWLSTVQLSSSASTSPDSIRFFGVWSETPFNRVEIRETGGSTANEFFGTVYGGGFKNRDRSTNTLALVCQFPLLAAHNFSLGASFVAPPPFDLGFGFAAYSANLGLKFCLPFAIAPPDIIAYADDAFNSNPNAPGACTKTFAHERVHSQFTNVLGIPVQYDYDWGDLGTPGVVHQNSDVEVYMLRGKLPPSVDEPSLAAFLGDEFATDGIYSDCDGVKETSTSGHLCPFAKDRKLGFGVGRGGVTYRFDVNMGLLDFVFVPVPKFPQGTKNPVLKQAALEILVEVAQIVWDVALGGWRFGRYVDRTQVVAVYDIHPPTITKAVGDFNDDGVTNAADQAFIDNVVIEADEVGGVSAGRFYGFLSGMYVTDDACNRATTFSPTFPTEELRVFWPVGTTTNDTSFDISWKASDAGPNTSGLPNVTTRLQHISVVDTRPPVMQPPMDIVELTAENMVTLDLGQPLVFDLVDLNPIIENDAVFPMSPGLHTVTWTATDASGNAASVNQSVNIKNSNIDPNALSLSGNQRQNAISFEPQEIRLEGTDADSDPLNFFIEDYPENGFFVAPLYPFFIEDYRLEATVDDDDLEQRCIDDPTPNGSNFFHFEQIRNPVYFSVLDDGTTYVMDYGYVQCRVDLLLPPQYRLRIAVFDATGAFVAGKDTSSVPRDLYIDARTDLVYTTFGELSNGIVNVSDADLNTIQSYNLFSMRDTNGVSVSIPFAKSAVLDGTGLMYILTNGGDVHAVRAEMDPGNTNLRPEYIGQVLQTSNQGTYFDMAIDTQDNLYVSMGDRVYKVSKASVDESGDFTLGSLVGWMGKCTADTAPGDQAVCDVTNQRSLGYSCTDATCPGASRKGDAPGQFDDPRGIAIDPNDVLYVTDYQNFRVQRFTPDGFFAGQAESACEGNCFVLGDFGRPFDIAVNSTHFFILDPVTDLLHISQTSPFVEIGDDYATVLYQSNNDFACLLSADCIDTFTFSVSDGVRDPDSGQMIRSAPALVQVEVARNFRPPFATPGIQVVAPEEQATAITLDGSDPDPLDTLSFSITRMPANGSLQVVDNQATYTSNIDYVGEDSFEFSVSDGLDTSAPEVINITVTDVNDPATVVFDESPVTVGRGFEVRLDGTLRDPDPLDQHALLVKWNDGSADEPEGEITMMGGVSGPLLLESETGSGTIRSTHIFGSSGNYGVEFCVTDRIDDSSGSKQPTPESLELCSPLAVQVQDMVDVTLEFSGPDALIRGQSSNYFVTVTNRLPDSGPGLTATGLQLAAQIDQLLITSAPAGCTLSNGRIDCTLADLAPGADTSLTIPIIVPGDPGPVAVVESQVNLTLNQPDTKGVNRMLVNTPLVFDADLIIGGRGVDEMLDEPDESPGNGTCEVHMSGACNLRAAIMEANASAGIQTIALGNAVFTLSQSNEVSPDSAYGDLDVTQDLLITGNGPQHTFINAAGIDRVFDVEPGATLELIGMSIAGGLTSAAEGIDGAGIRVQEGGRLVLRNVRLIANDAEGSGGAIFNDSSLADSLLIENSTISANTASAGAGIFSRGGGSLTNVTLSSNQAGSGSGGGLQVSGGPLALTNVTIASNSATTGGGLSVSPGGSVTLRNALLAGNSANTGPDCHINGGSLGSLDGNLVENPAGCPITPQSRDAFGVPAGIAPLADNGGGTQTHALVAGSPARDRGVNGGCPSTDQRGLPRPTDGVGNGQAQCDRGAFEADSVPFMETIFGSSFE